MCLQATTDRRTIANRSSYVVFRSRGCGIVQNKLAQAAVLLRPMRRLYSYRIGSSVCIVQITQVFSCKPQCGAHEDVGDIEGRTGFPFILFTFSSGQTNTLASPSAPALAMYAFPG